MRNNRLIVWLCLLCLLVNSSICAADIDLPDATKTGTVTITVKEFDGTRVPGGSLEVTLIAEVTKSGYRYTGDMKDCDVTLGDLQDSDLPKKIEAYKDKNKVNGTIQKVDDNGQTKYSDLKVGLYLVTQPEAAPGYYEIESFLVSVPMMVDGEWVYDVECSPKPLEKPEVPETEDTPVTDETPETEELVPTTDGSSTETEEPPTTQEPPVTGGNDGGKPDKPSDPQLPQTGQLNWPIPMMVSGGLLLIVIGWWMLLREDKKEK